ncbi:MAG: helix-turn-helix domain-containing protein [Candidatus Uhrbacteria bacterium]
MKKEITEVLERFGLRENDRRVYLAMLSLGSSTASPIARQTGLPATTVQSIAKRLVDLGLVALSKRKSRSVYEAEDPAVLKRILERQTEEVAGIIPMLKAMRSAPTVSPKIRVYDRERAADIFHAALASESKLVYEIVSARDLQDVLGEKFHFTKRRVAEGVRLNSLRVEANEIKKYAKPTHARELREARFLPRELTFRCSVLFWDDTVAFFATKAEGLAWTVESKTLRETYEQLFKLLWSVSRAMETAAA